MDSVAEVEAAAEKLTQSAGMDEDESFRVVMAVREAAVNAVLHGNGYDPNKQISASFENTGKSLVITIADEGFRQLHPGTELTLVKHLTPAEGKDTNQNLDTK